MTPEQFIEIKKKTHFKIVNHNQKNFRLAILDCLNVSNEKYLEIYNKLKSNFIIIIDKDFLKDSEFKMPESDVLLLIRDPSIPPSVVSYSSVLTGVYEGENLLILKKNLSLKANNQLNDNEPISVINKEISFELFFDFLETTLRVTK